MEIYSGQDVSSLSWLALGSGFISKQLGGEELGLLDWEEGESTSAHITMSLYEMH